MTNSGKIYWLLCLILALSFIVYTKTTSPIEVLKIISGSVSLLAGIGMYVWFVGDARQHVAQQASLHNKSASAMWLEMLKKVMLYMFVPAAIITAILIIVAIKLSS